VHPLIASSFFRTVAVARGACLRRAVLNRAAFARRRNSDSPLRDVG
jgi:hypothetical protein